MAPVPIAEKKMPENSACKPSSPARALPRSGSAIQLPPAKQASPVAAISVLVRHHRGRIGTHGRSRVGLRRCSRGRGAGGVGCGFACGSVVQVRRAGRRRRRIALIVAPVGPRSCSRCRIRYCNPCCSHCHSRPLDADDPLPTRWRSQPKRPWPTRRCECEIASDDRFSVCRKTKLKRCARWLARVGQACALPRFRWQHCH